MLSFSAVGRPQRSDVHLGRRLFHLIGGLGIIALSYRLPLKAHFATFLAVLLLIDLMVEGARLMLPQFNQWILNKFRSVVRSGEESRLSGITFYLLGSLMAVILFPRDVAVLSILYLAMGDPIAAVVGVARGKRLWPADVSPTRKSVEGSLACFVLCALATFAMTFYLKHTADFGLSERMLFALLGGFAASLGELLPLRADDNFSMPLISGTCLWTMGAFASLLPGLY